MAKVNLVLGVMSGVIGVSDGHDGDMSDPLSPK